jgi:hypothetical protein
MPTDGSGQQYFEAGNVRITCIENTWAGQRGLRIQSHQKENSGKLNPGAEIPIPDTAAAWEFIGAILAAMVASGVAFHPGRD